MATIATMEERMLTLMLTQASAMLENLTEHMPTREPQLDTEKQDMRDMMALLTTLHERMFTVAKRRSLPLMRDVLAMLATLEERMFTYMARQAVARFETLTELMPTLETLLDIEKQGSTCQAPSTK